MDASVLLSHISTGGMNSCEHYNSHVGSHYPLTRRPLAAGEGIPDSHGYPLSTQRQQEAVYSWLCLHVAVIRGEYCSLED